MKSEELIINTNSPKETFIRHLSLPQNDRIIFSGMFGIGKTYFLRHFFDQDKYNTVHLFPVNYSVANNQDIFKFIKYDILYDIIVNKEYRINEAQIEQNFDIYDIIGFSQLNLPLIIAYIVHFLPNIGRASSNFLEKTIGLWQSYKKGISESKNSDNDLHQITEFVKNTENHFLIENDFITQIIQDALINLKTGEKENILIIDDLDRIDPEHIFRLLNIFSASFDNHNTGYQNKFGFDKIILVLDIKNVRNIFHNKYGSDTDFSGYIDKFYSYEIFNYENTSAIADNVANILSLIKPDPKHTKIINFQGDGSTNELKHLLLCMVKLNAINLRTLFRLKEKTYSLPVYEFKRSGYTRSNIEFPPNILFDFMCKLFGNAHGFIKALDKCIESDVDTPSSFGAQYYVGSIVLFLNEFTEGTLNDKKPENPFFLNIHFELQRYPGGGPRSQQASVKSAKDINGNVVEVDYKLYLKLLKLAAEKIIKLQIISR